MAKRRIFESEEIELIAECMFSAKLVEDRSEINPHWETFDHDGELSSKYDQLSDAGSKEFDKGIMKFCERYEEELMSIVDNVDDDGIMDRIDRIAEIRGDLSERIEHDKILSKYIK